MQAIGACLQAAPAASGGGGAVSASWWRLYMTDGYTTQNHPTLAEMELHATVGGSSLCTGGTAFGSTPFSGSYTAANAFDGSLSTSWISNGYSFPVLVGYHLPVPSAVAEMKLSAPSSGVYPLGMPTSFELQYSLDSTNGTDGTWVTVFTATAQDAWNRSESRTYTTSTPPPTPMRVTGKLFWNPQVGATYHSTLTLTGDFVAPVTIDALSGTIPSWLTVSVSGTTVSFDGTVPDSSDILLFTPRATDSSTTPQSAAADPQVVCPIPSVPPGNVGTAWRVVMVGNDGYAGNYTYGVSELEFRIATGAPTACVGGSGYGGTVGNGTATNVPFDGNFSNAWTFNAATCELQYDATSKLTVAEVAIANTGTASPSGAPTKFIVQSAPDNASVQTFTTEWAVETTADWAGGETRVFHRPGSAALALAGTLARALVRQPYHAELLIKGDFTWPITVDVSSGALPSWLTMTVANNIVNLDGTAPSSTESDTFTVRVTDSSGTPQVATNAVSLSVENAPTVKGWRIALNNGGPIGEATVNELWLASTAGGASLASGGTPFASVNSGTSGNAFDGINDDYSKWDGGGGPFPVYLGYLFASAVQINEFRVGETAVGSLYIPPGSTSYTLQSSADTTTGLDGTWLDEWEVDGVALDGNTSVYTFTRPGLP